MDRELDEEMRGGLEMAAMEKMREGMSRHEALRVVRLGRESVETAKEVVRSGGWESFVESCWQDLRFAARMLRKSLGFTIVAVLTLALGIGATIAIFSVLYALALRSLPVQRPDQLVEVVRTDGGNLHTYAEWRIFRDRQEIFSSALAYNYSDTHFNVANAKGHQEISGAYVSGDYFSTLGVSAVLGRALQSSDDQPGTAAVCVIGYGLWRHSYGQSPDVLGQPIRVNGNEYRIAGVAPHSFFGVDVVERPEIFMPLEAERCSGIIRFSTDVRRHRWTIRLRC